MPSIDESIGDMKIRLSSNFVGATTLKSIGMVLEDCKNDTMLSKDRNQLVVGFCCAFERVVKGLGETCGVKAPQGKRYADESGYTYDTNIINYWMKIYNEKIKSTGGDYNSPAVKRHSVSYWQNLFWARNRIVHFGGKCHQNQVLDKGAIWGCEQEGDIIKTEHNKIDDFVNFFDYSFCNFFYDLDRVC